MLFCFSGAKVSEKQFHLERFIDWIILCKCGPHERKEYTVYENVIARLLISFGLPWSLERLLKVKLTSAKCHHPLSCHGNCFSFLKRGAMKFRWGGESQILRASRGVTGGRNMQNERGWEKSKQTSHDLHSANQLAKEINTVVCSISPGLEWKPSALTISERTFEFHLNECSDSPSLVPLQWYGLGIVMRPEQDAEKLQRWLPQRAYPIHSIPIIANNGWQRKCTRFKNHIQRVPMFPAVKGVWWGRRESGRAQCPRRGNKHRLHTVGNTSKPFERGEKEEGKSLKVKPQCVFVCERGQVFEGAVISGATCGENGELQAVGGGGVRAFLFCVQHTFEESPVCP